MKDESFHKPGYDGRLAYIDVMKEFMMAISKSSIAMDYPLWFNSLRGYFSVTSPFMSSKDRVEIKQQFKKIETRHKSIMNASISEDNKNNLLDSSLCGSLHEVTDMMYSKTRHLLLPANYEDEDELTEEGFGD